MVLEGFLSLETLAANGALEAGNFSALVVDVPVERALRFVDALAMGTSKYVIFYVKKTWNKDNVTRGDSFFYRFCRLRYCFK